MQGPPGLHPPAPFYPGGYPPPPGWPGYPMPFVPVQGYGAPPGAYPQPGGYPPAGYPQQHGHAPQAGYAVHDKSKKKSSKKGKKGKGGGFGSFLAGAASGAVTVITLTLVDSSSWREGKVVVKRGKDGGKVSKWPRCATTVQEHSGQSHSGSQSRTDESSRKLHRMSPAPDLAAALLPTQLEKKKRKESSRVGSSAPQHTCHARVAGGERMGRGRVEIKRIANDVSRRATFGKRSAGLLKKARELAVLCDVDLGVLVFDGAGAGRQLDYCSPNTSWSDLIERYESINHGEYQKLLADIATLRHERDHLEASVRRQAGEDLPSGATAAELRDLEHKLECALGKDKLMEEQLDESHHRVHILEDQNSFLRHMDMMSEEGRQRAAVEASAEVSELIAPVPPGTLFGGFFPELEEEEAATTIVYCYFPD
ncbi:uncharacterized protein [Aegilops tauschii subsp. strangulata]|uniref:MADS-box transcription factor 29 n=2 Tax=Triticinae TaxID=1648030 RepID=N1R5A2_AEGTA